MTKNDTASPPPDDSPTRCAGPHCQETLPSHKGTRRGRNQRYCSTRCRTAAYRARKEPGRRTHQEQILTGVEKLRSLPPVGDLSRLDEARVKNLAGLVERALTMHEAIDAALRETTPLPPAPQPRAARTVAQTETPTAPAPPTPTAQQTPETGRAPDPGALVSRRLADGSWAPTPEQEAVVSAALQGQNLAVIAGAGTGKTATLSLVGTALKGKRGLYVAFNRAIVDEAAARMPSNVTAATSHALAFRALGYRYRGRLGARRLLPAQVAEALGITGPLAVTERVILPPAALATQVMEMVRRFCHSADRTIHAQHLPPLAGLERAEHRRLAEHLLPLARTAWRDLKKPDGQGGLLKLTHDHYLKMWALSDPRLEYDFIALDEAQDTNPAVAALVRDQHAQQIVVGDSCQPSGTRVTVVAEQSRNTRWDGGRPALTRQVPIEEIREGDLVVSYNIAGRYVHRNGSPVRGISARPFHGSLIRVTDQQGRTSRYTPDHHCVVRFGDDIADKHVVYMMRKGDDYRVGVTGGRLQSQQKRLGLVLRALAEDADAAWIVSVHDTRAQAATAEAITSWSYGVPDVMFRAAGHSMGQDGVEEFWRKMGGNREQAAALLAAHGRDIDFPLWRRGERLQTRRAFVTRACNLIDGMEALPLTEEMLTDGHAISRKSWVPFAVTSEAYSGPVWSMTVEKDHTYVGDGIFTHNCQQIYGWRGVRDALETWPVEHRLLLSHSWRFGQHIAERANECLHALGMELRLVGNPSRESTVGPIQDPDVVLSRTNAAAMSRAMQEMEQGRRTALLGGAEGIRALAQAASELQAGRSASHPELSAFTSWHQVCEYVEQAPEDAGELSALVRLVDSYGPHTIISATHRMDTEDNAQVVCGTAHKAKGRQWATVEVADDFREPLPDKDGTPGTASRADLMLAYVTLTRAQYRLDPAGLEWIHARATGAPSPHPAEPRPSRERERAALPGAAPQPAPEPEPVVAAQPALDLAGSYIADLPGQGEVTITTKVKRRKDRTIIESLNPLLADKLAALSDYERPHVEMLLHGALIAIYDEPNGAPDSFLIVSRDRGRLCTTYQGHPDLTTDDVLDLAERLRAQLAGTAPPQPCPVPEPTPVEDVPWPHTSPAPTATTRADLESDIARYLDQCGGADDIDPATVAAAVVNHYGLRTWESLDEDQVARVLRL